MSRQFKVGDRVRLKNDYFECREGTEATVTSVGRADNRGHYLVFTDEKRGLGSLVAYDYRFELVSSASLNVSAASDEELADEYRRSRTHTVSMVDELLRRGYAFKKKSTGQTLSNATRTEDIRIVKVETITKEL